jgi:hypothetical protein
VGAGKVRQCVIAFSLSYSPLVLVKFGFLIVYIGAAALRVCPAS